MDETFSSIDLATTCLLDSERTETFGKVIHELVKPGHIVLDVGTGPGIMALFAARAGAKKVYAIESNPYTAKIATQNIENNNFKDIISVFLADARNINFKEGMFFDVVIMEMLTTGMVDEYQVWAVNNLFSKGYVNEKTIFVPYRHDTFITPMETNFVNYGFYMRMVKHVWNFLPKQDMRSLADKSELHSISFNKNNNINSKTDKIFEIKEDGVLNSIYLESETWLNKTVRLGDTLALNAPVIYPLFKDVQVKKGDKVRLKMKYMFGNGYRNLETYMVKL
ncbi:MAG: Methyltransferase small [Parcubacteria group bacterium GW2011_GWF2_44_8b]|nr:MAG: hypothetical protein UV94_C0019G0006 [Parcubacteria group bacterium GW2011_GWC1_43_30]KKT79513.1 MAG: Methyltransferase small [Parcubacteria group bacterium GW2011_GWF2_44_8b]KKT85341.1 MAG: Methyltransferase small [Parcubacteria group bacterium GW2011_GWD1_44_9]